MTQRLCGRCGAESELYLCTGCAAEFVTDVVKAAITYEGRHGTTHCLLDELDVTLARLQRMARSAGVVAKRSTEQPLPFDARASVARERIERAIMRALPLATTNRDARVIHGPRFAARVIVGNASALMGKPAIVDIAHALAQANNEALALIDRPPDRWYAGICSAATEYGSCEHDLYALPDATIVQCPSCGTVHNVQQRREALLAAAEDVLATATEIARAITLFGEEIAPQRIHVWASRKRLTAKGVSTAGHPLYRVGDVLTLARSVAMTRVAPHENKRVGGNP